MVLLVNGEAVPDELIRSESDRIRSLKDWEEAARTADELDFRVRVRQEAERCAIDKVLIMQQLRKDTRPLDPELLARELERASAQLGARPGVDEGALRGQVEGTLRYQRTVRDLSGNLPAPRPADVRKFYATYRQNFRGLDQVAASHIVRNIDETHSEEEALAGIEAAMRALEQGEPFASVASRLSDCPERSGDLGSFQRGVMVPEFEAVVFALQPGERSPIFRTPFGYHIAEVRSSGAGGVAPFEDVREDIERVMRTMREHEAFKRSMDELRAGAEIRRVSREEALNAARAAQG